MARKPYFAPALLLAGCAIGNSNPPPVRIFAPHYQSMNGVSVATDSGPMTCAREALTGTHILQWYCRFPAESSQQYRLDRQIVFVAR